MMRAAQIQIFSKCHVLTCLKSTGYNLEPSNLATLGHPSEQDQNLACWGHLLRRALHQEPMRTPEAHPVKARYQRLVDRGALRHDPYQWQVVERLSSIYDAISAYASSMSEFNGRLEGYQARRSQRLRELEEQEPQIQSDAAGSSSASQQPSSSETPGVKSWLGGWLAGVSTAGSSLKSTQAKLTPEQQAKLRASRLDGKVLREIGPPPSPPSAPKGLYLWGSVGSGKSLLMDLFYDAVASTLPELQQHRRMHFNAAMLEVHSRIHKLDMKERARMDRLSDQAMDSGAQQAALADEDDVDDGEASAAGVMPTHDKRGLFRYWDSEVQRQREAKAAMLAIRKHMRLARAGRTRPDALAKANSAQMRQVAAEFLTAARAASSSPGGGALPHASSPVPRHSSSVLCFDEMQVSDVFSAVALKALLEGLTQSGCVVVTTSNRKPRDLPRHGLHEDMFDNLIHTIEATCDVEEMSSQDDYRRLLLKDKDFSASLAAAHAADARDASASSGAPAAGPSGRASPQLPSTFLHPLGPPAEEQLEEAWGRLVVGEAAGGAGPCSVPVMFGRSLEVPQAVGGVARFRFEELCARTLGSADYVALAAAFHTVVITGVPVMSMEVRDQARRFITLVDELYNARVRLVCSAAAAPDLLFSSSLGSERPILDLEQMQFESAVEGSKLRTDLLADGGVGVATPEAAREAAARMGGAEEQFAFARAVSRLHEMQSAVYLTVSAVARQR